MRKLMLVVVVLAIAAALAPRIAVAVTTDPDPQQRPTITPDMTVTDLENRGDLARVRKDYRGAIDYYRAALKKDRNNAVLYNKIGICDLQMSELRAAQSDFDKAVKRNGKYAEALNNIGVVAYMQKNYGKAVRYYKKALALNEANASFHSNLGTAWFAQKNFERASAEYLRALELDPEVLLRSATGGVSAQIRPEDRANYAFLLAKLYAQRGDLDRCLECLKKAKDEGYPKMMDVYKDEIFANVRSDARLTEVVPPPPPKR